MNSINSKYSNGLARLLALGTIIGTLLVGCGGGSGGLSMTGGGVAGPAITGVAAAGAPILNGVVTIQDSASPAHTAVTTTDATTGNYSFTAAQLSGWTQPYMLEINYKLGGVTYLLHSAANDIDLTTGGGSGTINITPLTDLVIANLAGDIATNVFKNKSYSTLLTPAALSAGTATLAAQLAAYIKTIGGINTAVDLFRTSFKADGTGLDAVLDALKVTVDPTTKTALIISRLDGSTVTDVLGTPSTTPLPVPTITVPVTDLTAIKSYFSSFSAEIALVPASTDPALLAFFDNTSFKQNGQNLSKFLQKITTDPTILGGTLSFADITLNPVPTWVTTVPPTATASYKVHFTVLTGGLPNGREEFIMYKNSTGNWIALGNQKVAKANIEALATSGLMNNGMLTTRVNCTGLWPQINDNGGVGYSFAVVNGPGLPSAGLLLFANGSLGNDFTLAAGVPSTYNGTATAPATTNLTTCGFNSLYPLTDTAIAAIAAGSKYTIKLYQDLVAGTPNAATATLVATYGPNLSAAPLTSTQLTASLFPSAESATPAILPLALGATVTSSTISWTAPAAANLYASGVGIWINRIAPPAYTSVFGSVAGNATSTSIAIPLLTGANYAGVTLNYFDNSFREYWTSF